MDTSRGVEYPITEKRTKIGLLRIENLKNSYRSFPLFLNCLFKFPGFYYRLIAWNQGSSEQQNRCGQVRQPSHWSYEASSVDSGFHLSGDTMSNPQKKRNFQIEAFKHKVVVDPKYADKTWKILEHAIHEIYNHNASGLSFEELYRLFWLHAPLSLLILSYFCALFFFFCFNQKDHIEQD